MILTFKKFKNVFMSRSIVLRCQMPPKMILKMISKNYIVANVVGCPNPLTPHLAVPPPVLGALISNDRQDELRSYPEGGEY
ncbi:hypothetical protein FOBRF1_007172 [Fusarium oxysporum]